MLFCLVFLLVWFLLGAKPALAVTVAEQTQAYSPHTLGVWQVIQELGDNLSGTAKSFTFRVSTVRSNTNQFDYTAKNTDIYDKTTNALVVAGGCIPAGADPYDRTRGLIFSTDGVPEGYEDVTIDFSCRSYEFVLGHRYLIKITNANIGNEGSGQILFGAAAYFGDLSLDYFTGGGLRYGHGNIYDIYNNGGACDPIAYIWGDTTLNPSSGCNIWTSPRDDLYFILTNTSPPPKTPVIFIPGIGGSELKASQDIIWSKDDGHGGIFSHAYPSNGKVWVNQDEATKLGDDDYFDVLRLKPDGVTSEAALSLTGNLGSFVNKERNFSFYGLLVLS